jgi:PmbA protein
MNTNVGDMAQSILALARGKVDAAEVLYQDSESRGVDFQDNQLKTVSGGAMRGAGLRVIHNGRLGFSCTSDFDRLDALVDDALASAQFGELARFEFPSAPDGLPEVKIFDPAVAGLGMDRAADLVRDGIRCVLDAVPDCHCSGGVGAEHGHTVLCNSSGLHHEEISSEYGISIGGFLVRGEGFLSVGEGEDSSRFSPDVLRHARRVVEWIRLAEKEARVGEESLPVLLTPNALEFLLSTFVMNTNGKTVQKGASVLANRIGEKVLGENVTIADDPLVDYAAGSMAIDGEGTPARRNVLFENGVLRRFLFDLQTAALLSAAPTGSGMRGYSSSPSPGTSNWRMAAGMTPYAQMLAGLKRGILLDAALGAGQSNMLAGDFSVNVELGFLVEDGEIIGRVKDCMIAGNAFDAFNRIREISAETEWHGTTELPYVCFDEMSVVGR